MNQLYSTTLAVSLGLSTLCASAQLSAPEKKAIAYVDNHTQDALSLLTESVNINSGTLNIAGVKKVGELYAAALSRLGASGNGAHKAGETINLKEFSLLIQRAAIFMYRLTR